MKTLYLSFIGAALLTTVAARSLAGPTTAPDIRTAATGTATASHPTGATTQTTRVTVTLKQSGKALPANTKIGRLLLYTPTDTLAVDLETGMKPYVAEVPAGTLVTLREAPDPYRGFVCKGFRCNAGPASALTTTGVTVPAKGLRIEARYTADKTDRSQYLFYTYDADGAPYRIPAIAKARNGHLVAFADKRWCGADIGYGHIDIVARISADNGRTWGRPFTVVRGSGVNGAPDCGYGDAAVVADSESDRLLIISGTGHRTYWSKRDNPLRTARYYSNDNGQTWTAPEDITETIYALVPGANGIFLGSGRICQSRLIKKGNAYRLYAALATQPTGNFVIYSDDFGQSWQVLGSATVSCAPKGDEPKCEELPDGSVILSSRKHGGRYYNVFTYTDKLAATGSWAEAVASNEVPGGLSFGKNATNGEVLLVRAVEQATGTPATLLLQSIPTGNGRSHVSLFYKVIENRPYTPAELATGWTRGLEVSQRGSAYSTLCLQADGRIGFYYEEEPNWYCMVYEPLTLERITGGKFRPAPDR